MNLLKFFKIKLILIKIVILIHMGFKLTLMKSLIN